MHRLRLTFSTKVMSACSSSFRDIINISVVSFHCIHSWFIKPWYSLENVEFSQSWRGNALTVLVWTRNNLIFNLKRGAEKKQVQTPLSVCVCVCVSTKKTQSLRRIRYVVCVRRVQCVRPADARRVVDVSVQTHSGRQQRWRECVCLLSDELRLLC